MAFSDLLFLWSFLDLIFNEQAFSFWRRPDFICLQTWYIFWISFSVIVGFKLNAYFSRQVVAILFPMQVSMISGRLRSKLILLSWVFSLVFFIPTWFEVRLGKETEKPRICSPKSNALYSAYLSVGFLGLYFLPLSIITNLNIRIINSLRKTNPVIRGNSLSRDTRSRRNQRIMKMLILIIVFFLCSTPQYVFFAIWEFTSDVQLYKVQIFYIFAGFILPFLSTFLNPVIIFSLSTNYRQALKNYLRFVCVARQSYFKSNQSAFEENVELPEIRVQP